MNRVMNALNHWTVNLALGIICVLIFWLWLLGHVQEETWVGLGYGFMALVQAALGLGKLLDRP